MTYSLARPIFCSIRHEKSEMRDILTTNNDIERKIGPRNCRSFTGRGISQLTAGTKRGGNRGSCSGCPACCCCDWRRGSSARRCSNCRRGSRGSSPYPALSDSAVPRRGSRHTNQRTIPTHCRSCRKCPVGSAFCHPQGGFCRRNCYRTTPHRPTNFPRSIHSRLSRLVPLRALRTPTLPRWAGGKFCP